MADNIGWQGTRACPSVHAERMAPTRGLLCSQPTSSGAPWIRTTTMGVRVRRATPCSRRRATGCSEARGSAARGSAHRHGGPTRWPTLLLSLLLLVHSEDAGTAGNSFTAQTGVGKFRPAADLDEVELLARQAQGVTVPALALHHRREERQAAVPPHLPHRAHQGRVAHEKDTDVCAEGWILGCRPWEAAGPDGDQQSEARRQGWEQVQHRCCFNRHAFTLETWGASASCEAGAGERPGAAHQSGCRQQRLPACRRLRHGLHAWDWGTSGGRHTHRC